MRACAACELILGRSTDGSITHTTTYKHQSIGDLGAWIPHGYDVYVVGLQECLCMEELQAAIHKHLGGASCMIRDSSVDIQSSSHSTLLTSTPPHIHKPTPGPKRYTIFTQAIGSTQTTLGFHGMIALAVWARTDEVKSGCFVPYEGANATVNQASPWASPGPGIRELWVWVSATVMPRWAS